MFSEENLRALLERVRHGQAPIEEALDALRTLPFEPLGFATLDHHRPLRTGSAEVVFCSGKTADQVATIVARLAARSPQVLGTRATREQYLAALAQTPELQYHDLARCLYLDREPDRPRLAGVAVVCAGTSDLPVAEEAAVTLEVMGHRPARVVDVGVAGLHRLLPPVEMLRAANVVVGVAGMEGALPSVIAGLVGGVVIATPTSVGYGASFGGLAAMLGMLNACAPGICVVNIDNGFGAGQLAATINRRVHEARAAGAAEAMR